MADKMATGWHLRGEKMAEKNAILSKGLEDRLNL